MKFPLRTLLALAVSFVSSVVVTAHADYGIYYGTSQTYANKTFKLSPVIVQPYNLSLYAKYSGPKICYLSAGEFDGASAELDSLGLSGAVVGFNAEWNSYVMDMGSASWTDYLIRQEALLKSKGCAGLFLDTVWQSGYENQAVVLVKTLRSNWKTANIVVNNAHDIKYRIKDDVDGFMFENFWDRGTVASSSDGQWYVAQMAEYADLKKNFGKKLYALSYGNPFTYASWGKTVRAHANAYGFELVFANANLTTIYGYLKSATGAIAKP